MQQDVAVGFVIAAMIAVPVMLILLNRHWNRHWQSADQADGETIATIEERVHFSAGGAGAVALLVLFNLGAVLAAVATWDSAANIPNMAALVWVGVGWNVLWGTGAIIGRKRVYVVRRAHGPEN